MTTAFIFPGQGSQVVGMGKTLADNFSVAQNVFAEVDEALGEKLSSIMWEGPSDTLTLTRNAQPALMATSIAALRVLEAETSLDVKEAACVAGHSLGEYSALCAARALSISDTAKLLRIRGDAMQEAVPVGDGAMAAILGLDMEAIQQVMDAAKSEGICEIANDNAPGQIVISGDKAAVEASMAAAKDAGAKRALLLPVSAPFHCALMAPAADRMQVALAEVTIRQPLVPVIANVTASAVTDPEVIEELLVKQVTGRVRWTESVCAMNDAGVERFIEVGAGKVLSGLVKRICKEANTANISDADDLAKFN